MSARVIDVTLELVVGAALAVLAGLGERPIAFVVLIWVVAVAYEAASVVMFGATLGKARSKLRIQALDTSDRGVPPDQALARAAAAATAAFGPLALAVAGLTTLGLLAVGLAAIWATVTAVTTTTDALGRGSVDRVAATMVVPAATDPPIRSRDLPGYADAARPPRVGPRGRVGDAEVRIRARLRRLNGATALVVILTGLVFVTTLPVGPLLGYVLVTAAWLVAFVVDETRTVAGPGTPGHRLAGLVVVDRATGAAPTTRASFVRALVLGLSMFVPLGWPALAVSLWMLRNDPEARTVHDRAAGTVVVADPKLDPEVQRRRAMRMRLGRVG